VHSGNNPSHDPSSLFGHPEEEVMQADVPRREAAHRNT